MKISNRLIGKDNPLFFIAEAGVNHNGSIEIAKKLVDSASNAGADAVKFQTFKTENIVTLNAPKSTYHIRTTGSDNDLSWYELLKTQELDKSMHIDLMKYCEKKNIIFLSTPYDNESADLLDDLGIAAFKTASTDTNNIPFLKYLAKKGKPIIMSSAMCNMDEVNAAIETLREGGISEIAMLQCTGNYPAKLEDSNLNVINEYLNKLDCLVGYSDHTIGLINPIAATALGASIYEKHITIDKTLPGPDQKMALNPIELKETINAIRMTEKALGNNKKNVLESELENRVKLRKSLVANLDINLGDLITLEMIGTTRPGSGLKPGLIENLIGKKSKRKIKKDSLFIKDDMF